AATFANPQTAGEIAKQVRERNCIGLVAEREGQVVGFVIYQVFRLRRAIICMAVDPQHQRTGIASSMLSYLLTGIIRKRESQPCTITALVRENNLPTLN